MLITSKVTSIKIMSEPYSGTIESDEIHFKEALSCYMYFLPEKTYSVMMEDIFDHKRQ